MKCRCPTITSTASPAHCQPIASRLCVISFSAADWRLKLHCNSSMLSPRLYVYGHSRIGVFHCSFDCAGATSLLAARGRRRGLRLPSSRIATPLRDAGERSGRGGRRLLLAILQEAIVRILACYSQQQQSSALPSPSLSLSLSTLPPPLNPPTLVYPPLPPLHLLPTTTSSTTSTSTATADTGMLPKPPRHCSPGGEFGGRRSWSTTAKQRRNWRR